jgi:hypothetical protein
MSGILGGLIGSFATASTSSYESIATVTVGSGGSSSISFSSIPSTYKHLQIRFIANRQTSASNIPMQFNSDTGTNYAFHYINGDGASATAGSGTANTWDYASLFNPTGTSFVGGVVDILDYTSTNKYKTIRSLAGADLNGSGNIALSSGLWLNTSAISTITLTANSGTFSQYSSFALYGIKG